MEQYSYYQWLALITCALPLVAFVAAATAIIIIPYIQSLLKYFHNEEN
ncbi:hypothetical protein SAMN05660461_5972 [Chitinophaga ginsengisegetis]|uniref:Uncharacterized protein n=1 Tax=Chitinophaga ginsengisegetis TaxID=393003 RepID=A0A1T5PBQ0_9BACT|nr:hypothetical protein SAMN05660461_5972 [Chitinophaga ginsengisegetis]